MGIRKEASLDHASMQGVRVPIRMKITLPYLILSLALAVAAALLITQLVTENVEERFNKQLYEAGKISSELSVSYESQLLETERLLANEAGVAQAIRSHDPDALRLLTLGVITNDHQEAAEFLDVLGNHVLSVHHRPGGNVEEYIYSSGGPSAFSNLDIVKRVLAQTSDGRGDKYADLVQTDGGMFIYVAGPVWDADKHLAGVVLVGRSLATWASDLRLQTFAQVTLYDHEGNVAFSTLPFPEKITPQLVAETISFKDLSSTKRTIPAHRKLSVTNIPFAEILGSWEVRGNHELGVLGVALSQNMLVQASANSRWQIFGLVATANFLIILVGINLANRITRPLLQLVRASVRVSRGDLDVQVRANTNDEISILTDSFNAMVRTLSQSQQDLIQAYDSTLEGWAKALELRDKETEGHSDRVASLTVQLAEALGIDGEALINIRRGSLLHDIGKMAIPDSILRKAGPLTPAERSIIEEHPQNAYNMLKHIKFLQDALEIPYSHHEKWDGTGYPRGLRGEEIPLSARMFAIVDVFDALTSDRPYRNAIDAEEAIEYLKHNSGMHFDPTLVNTFLHLLEQRKNG